MSMNKDWIKYYGGEGKPCYILHSPYNPLLLHHLHLQTHACMDLPWRFSWHITAQPCPSKPHTAKKPISTLFPPGESILISQRASPQPWSNLLITPLMLFFLFFFFIFFYIKEYFRGCWTFSFPLSRVLEEWFIDMSDLNPMYKTKTHCHNLAFINLQLRLLWLFFFY